jgi:hypothetical protein
MAVLPEPLLLLPMLVRICQLEVVAIISTIHIKYRQWPVNRPPIRFEVTLSSLKVKIIVIVEKTRILQVLLSVGNKTQHGKW